MPYTVKTWDYIGGRRARQTCRMCAEELSRRLGIYLPVRTPLTAATASITHGRPATPLTKSAGEQCRHK